MPFDFYFAGSQCEESTKLIETLNANVLKSYINEQRSIHEWFDRKKNGWKGKLLIDNGAFTIHRKGGNLDIDEYITWLDENHDNYDYAIALDRIPGIWGQEKTAEDLKFAPVKTWENYLYMIKKCKYPDKILPVFHQKESFDYLKQMLEFRYDSHPIYYICLSGNKELTKKQREDWYCICYDIIKKSSNPNVKTHILGSATISDAVNFPCTSMDASSWIMTGANGSIYTDRGQILISSSNKKEKDNAFNMSADVLEYVSEQCKKWGYTLEQASENYRYRMLINIHWLYDQSRNCKYVGRKNRKKFLF